MTQPIPFHALANIFPLLEGREFDELVGDIGVKGLIEPVVLHEGAILDGRNRYRACLAAGAEPRFEEFKGYDALSFVVSKNLKRRHLSEEQRAIVAGRVANLKHGVRSDRAANLPLLEEPAPPPVTQAEAAQLLNVSERSVRSAKAVLNHGAPELVQAVERGAVSVSAAADVATRPVEEQRQIVARGEREILQAAKQIRAEKAQERHQERISNLAEISKGNVALGTEQRYPVIYADPPWRYENPPIGATNRAIENHYPTMTLEEICALPVGNLATDDAILYLWATAPKLAECFEVITAWGFTYRTCFVWVKDKIGMGYHARNQHELLLVAKRGEIPPPPVEARVSSVVYGDRTEHSAKPLEFYGLIESFYPELPKIELFSRSPREGWAAWGNQASAA